MKLKSIVSTGLFAALTALSMGAQAASDADKSAEAKVPTTEVKSDTKMKPHSHMEEKTGIAQQTQPAATAEKKSGNRRADKDKSKHFHPRDGKS